MQTVNKYGKHNRRVSGHDVFFLDFYLHGVGASQPRSICSNKSFQHRFHRCFKLLHLPFVNFVQFVFIHIIVNILLSIWPLHAQSANVFPACKVVYAGAIL